jgi:hypothetical protein
MPACCLPACSKQIDRSIDPERSRERRGQGYITPKRYFCRSRVGFIASTCPPRKAKIRSSAAALIAAVALVACAAPPIAAVALSQSLIYHSYMPTRRRSSPVASGRARSVSEVQCGCVRAHACGYSHLGFALGGGLIFFFSSALMSAIFSSRPPRAHPRRVVASLAPS